MLTRRLEPEVMDTAEDAHDYDTMDHSAVNRLFAHDLLTFGRTSWLPRPGDAAETVTAISILDVGTGTALMPIELCRQHQAIGTRTQNTAPVLRITAIDAAAEMLKLAQRNVRDAGLAEAIGIEQVDAKSMSYATASFDIVMSNSIVHHIPEPWSVFSEMARVLRAGGILFVRDLLRPESDDQVERIVATYAGTENAHSQMLFRDSLHAALTLDEVRELTRRIGVPDHAVQPTSDRHWTLAWHTAR